MTETTEMVALQIVRRDLVRMVRSPLRTALLFAMPLMLAAIFALVFGSGSAAVTVRVLVHDQDQGLVSRLLGGAAGSAQLDERLDLVLVGEEGDAMMEEGGGSALVRIPEGFSNDFLAGNPVTLEVVKNPAQRFLPQAVEEVVTVGAVTLSQASRVFRPELEQLHSMISDHAFPADVAVSTLSVGITAKMRQLERFALPPIVELDSVTLTEAGTSVGASGRDILSYFLPGLSLMGILFLAQASTRDILLERESGLLRQLLTAPVTVGQYLVGKCLSVLVVSALGFTLLVVVGLAAGVSWGPPTAVIALILASSVAASGTLLLIMSLVGSQRQGDALTTIVIIIWSLLGGVFVPLSQIPAFLRTLSRSTLTYWAVDGFNTLILGGGSLADVALHLAVLVSAGGGFLVVGAALLRRRIRRGLL